MRHPQKILDAIDNAIDAVEKDILDRSGRHEGHLDLNLMKKELIEMKEGKRLTCSDDLLYVMRDSMDWDQACRKAFNKVRSLLMEHYHKKI